MRYSVLLPTRNGGPFLKNCVLSILGQGYDDLELVISDNANTDDTPEVIAQFMGDPRVKAVRLDQPVSVTENWNNAFRASSGDYILMMGDDDCLLSGYFQWMDGLLERHGYPDCVVYNAYSYVAPGSIADDPKSYYKEAHFTFPDELHAERLMPQPLRSKIVRDMFQWKIGIPLNMQTTLISRKSSMLVKGGVFRAEDPVLSRQQQRV